MEKPRRESLLRTPLRGSPARAASAKLSHSTSTLVSINDLPLDCLEFILRIAVNVCRRPLELRQVCTLWQSVLLDLFTLQLSRPSIVDGEGKFTLRHKESEVNSVGPGRFTALELTGSTIVKFVNSVALGFRRGIDREILTMANDLAEMRGVKTDCRVHVTLYGFVSEYYGAYWLKDYRSKPLPELDDKYCKRVFDVDDVIGLIFDDPHLDATFEGVFPNLRVRSVRFDESYSDYVPHAGFLCRMLSFFAGGNSLDTVILAENVHWLGSLTKSCFPSVLKLSVSSRGLSYPSIVTPVDFATIPLLFPAVEVLEFDLTKHGASLLWLADLTRLWRLRLMVSVAKEVAFENDLFPETLPSCVREFQLVLHHSASMWDRSEAVNVDVAAAESCLRMASNIAEISIQFSAEMVFVFDTFVRLLQARGRPHFAKLESLRLVGVFSEQGIFTLLAELHACSRLRSLVITLGDVERRKNAEDLFKNLEYLSTLTSRLPESVERFEIYDTNFASWFVVRDVTYTMPRSRCIARWIVHTADALIAPVRNVVLAFPHVVFAGERGSSVWAREVFDLVRTKLEQRASFLARDGHVEFVYCCASLFHPMFCCKFSWLSLDDGGAASSDHCRRQFEVRFGG